MSCQCRDSHQFLTNKCHCHGKVFFVCQNFQVQIDHPILKYYKLLGAGVPRENTLFEKSPTYYKSLTVPKYIRDMDPKTKIVLVTCNNVRRLLSRYKKDFTSSVCTKPITKNLSCFRINELVLNFSLPPFWKCRHPF